MAAQEPSGQEARKDLTRTVMIARLAEGKREESTRIRWLSRSASDLSMLDAFCFSAGLDPSFSFKDLQRLSRSLRKGLSGPAFRLARWVETWDSCRTGQQRGRQALITVGMLRDAGGVAASTMVRHLRDAARHARDHRAAFRLEIGSLLFAGRLSPARIEQAERKYDQRGRGLGSTEKRQARATHRASLCTPLYVLYFNPLWQQSEFQKKEFKHKARLEHFLRSKLVYAKGCSPAIRKSAGRIRWHLGMDLVGVLNNELKPAVHFYELDSPNLLTRRWCKKNREWHLDLEDFLRRKLTELTVWELIQWHETSCQTQADAQKWLDFGDRKPNDVDSFKSDMIERIKGVEPAGLQALLKEFGRELQRLRKEPHSNRFAEVKSWCRAVDRHALSARGARRESVSTRMVYPPPRNKLKEDPHLIFNGKYNYLLVGES